ncbi:MAG TPA: hypothetical protein VHW47_06365, partial [Acidimicrobiales bacterium]|nr:hypothetical protein [Acidimicrobiales bacterium]
NRRSHTALVNVLSGKTVPGKRANQVIVNLTPVLTKVIDQLDARGITIFDGAKVRLAKAESLTLHLASSKQIAEGRKFFQAASDLGWAAPLLAVIAMVAALVVAVDRRKTLLRIAVGVALLTLLVLAGLALGRSFFLSHAASRVTPSVTGAIFDTLVRFLTHGLRQVLLISVIVAAVLWLIGPARWPRWLRAQGVRGVRWIGQRAAELGNEHNRRRASAASRAGAGQALEHASGLRLVGVVVAGIVLVFGGNLSVSGVWSTVIGLAAYLAVLELIFAWARRAAAAPAVAGTGSTVTAVTAVTAVPAVATTGAVARGEGGDSAAAVVDPAADPVTADLPAPDPLLVEVGGGAVGLPAAVEPLGQEDDRRAEDTGDDDDHDQGRLG